MDVKKLEKTEEPERIYTFKDWCIASIAKCFYFGPPVVMWGGVKLLKWADPWLDRILTSVWSILLFSFIFFYIIITLALAVFWVASDVVQKHEPPKNESDVDPDGFGSWLFFHRFFK